MDSDEVIYEMKYIQNLYPEFHVYEKFYNFKMNVYDLSLHVDNRVRK